MEKKISLIYQQNTDFIGSIASLLCLFHCVATPYIFFSYTASTAIEQDVQLPIWWGFIDSILLIISIVAIYWSSRNSTSNWIKLGLYSNWVFITFLIVNEKIELLLLAEWLIYIPSLSLVTFHLYNRKYCTCYDNSCCVINDWIGDLIKYLHI